MGELPSERTSPARFARTLSPQWAERDIELNERGYSVFANLLAPAEWTALAVLYDDDATFRSRVVMARHNFGRGEYKYFAYPLPAPVATVRAAMYPPLAAIANRWHAAMDIETRFPAAHAAFLKLCHEAGQTRPTPLLLRYGAGDHNCLHQDLYGDQVFPIQATVLLSAPGRDFTGGEFVLTEQRPRMQSRAEVVPLGQGDAVLFAVNQRPRHHAPRRQPHPFRPSHDAGRDLPRCAVRIRTRNRPW